jgi:formate hydrogenlyase subunit 3/multisubunit Na+/H+ antiporter MnhD subunit
MMNLDLWQPDTLTMAASALGGLVAIAGVLMSVNVFRHEGNAGTISPKKRTFAFVLIGLAVVAGAIGLLVAHVGAVWFSVHALAAIAIASLSLYERGNTKELMQRFGVRVVFGALLVALGLIVMKFNPMQLAPGTVAAQVAFILVFLGYGVSLGVAPMHGGLSELYSKIPSPVAALVAPLTLLVGTLGIFRMRFVVDGLLADAGTWTGNILIVFGLLTAATLACTVLRQKNYKKFFAEIVMFHTGAVLMFAGFGVAGVIPALMHLCVTLLLASVLFCAAGILHATYKTTKFSGVRNMAALLPVPLVLLVLVSIGAVGVPVSGMFVSMMIGIGYGLQFHLAFTLLFVLTWIVMIAGVTMRLLDLTHKSQNDAVALLPVRWRLSLAVLTVESLMILAAVWWLGTKQGVAFCIEAAQVIATF